MAASDHRGIVSAFITSTAPPRPRPASLVRLSLGNSAPSECAICGRMIVFARTHSHTTVYRSRHRLHRGPFPLRASSACFVPHRLAACCSSGFWNKNFKIGPARGRQAPVAHHHHLRRSGHNRLRPQRSLRIRLERWSMTRRLGTKTGLRTRELTTTGELKPQDAENCRLYATALHLDPIQLQSSCTVGPQN